MARKKTSKRFNLWIRNDLREQINEMALKEGLLPSTFITTNLRFIADNYSEYRALKKEMI